MEFSKQEHWSGLPFPSPGDLSDPGVEPGSPKFQADSSLSELRGNSPELLYDLVIAPPGIYPKELKTGTQTTFMPVLVIAILFTKAKR